MPTHFVLCDKKDWLPNSQHFLKRSWREGERLLWIVPFDNIAYLQIDESNHMNLHEFVKKLLFVKKKEARDDFK